MKNVPKTGSHRLEVSTNVANGYSVTAAEDRPLASGSDTIPDVTGDAADIDELVSGVWALASTHGFGYTLANVNGTDAVFTSGYKQFADTSGGEAAQQVMASAGPVSGNSVDVGYKVNIGPSQPQGTYTTQITYIATGNF